MTDTCQGGMDKIMDVSHSLFGGRYSEGLKLYLSRLYFELHKQPFEENEKIRLFKIYCKIMVKTNEISSQNVEESGSSSNGLDVIHSDVFNIFEIECNFLIPDDVLFNKKSKENFFQNSLKTYEFYQSNDASICLTFETFSESIADFNKLLLVFNSLVINGRFDVLKIFVNEFHASGDHSVCKFVNSNWLSILNSFIPTANTNYIRECTLLLAKNSCNEKKCICLCKFIKWVIIRCLSLVVSKTAGFSIILIFIQDMESIMNSKNFLICGGKSCNFESCFSKLIFINQWVKQYIYYVIKTGYLDVFEYISISSPDLIYKILKNTYSSVKKYVSECKNCKNGYIFLKSGKCEICLNCSNPGVVAIYNIINSVINSRLTSTLFENDGDIDGVLPFWASSEINTFLTTFTKGISYDVKSLFSEVLSIEDEDISFTCDLIYVLLSYELEYINIYDIIKKIESIYPKLSVKTHSKWLIAINYILEQREHLLAKDRLFKEFNKIIKGLKHDSEIVNFLAKILKFESQLLISDIRKGSDLDGLHDFIALIVKSINYTDDDSLIKFIKNFSRNMASYANLSYSSLILLFLSVLYSDSVFKSISILLLYEFVEPLKIVVCFFYYVCNPGFFVFNDEYKPISSPPNQLQSFVFLKYLLKIDGKCDPTKVVTWAFDLKVKDDNAFEDLKHKYDLLSSLLSICTWADQDEYPYVHMLLKRLDIYINMYQHFQIDKFLYSESPLKLYFSNDIEYVSLGALITLISTLPSSPELEGIIDSLDIEDSYIKELKTYMIFAERESSGSITPEYMNNCLEFTDVTLSDFNYIADSTIAMRFAEKMLFKEEFVGLDSVWWLSDSIVDYSAYSHDNQILIDIKCSIDDSFSQNTYRNLFDFMLTSGKEQKNLDHFDKKCIRFLVVWSYDPEWAFLTLIHSKDFKYVFTRLLKYRQFVDDNNLRKFFNLCEKYLGNNKINQIKQSFEFSKLLLSIDSNEINLSKITNDPKYRQRVLKSMPPEFVERFYSGFIGLQYKEKIDDITIDLDSLIKLVHSNEAVDDYGTNVYKLSEECAEVLINNLTMEDVLNPLIRMRLLLYPDKLIPKLIRMNSRFTRSDNFMFSWFTLRKLLAQALELYPIYTGIHGSDSMDYLYFIQSLVYILPDFDLYLLHRASLSNSTNDYWDSVKNHLKDILTPTAEFAINSMLDSTKDDVRELLHWIRPQATANTVKVKV